MRIQSYIFQSLLIALSGYLIIGLAMQYSQIIPFTVSLPSTLCFSFGSISYFIYCKKEDRSQYLIYAILLFLISFYLSTQ